MMLVMLAMARIDRPIEGHLQAGSGLLGSPLVAGSGSEASSESSGAIKPARRRRSGVVEARDHCTPEAERIEFEPVRSVPVWTRDLRHLVLRVGWGIYASYYSNDQKP